MPESPSKPQNALNTTSRRRSPAAEVCNKWAPEHLEVLTAANDPDRIAQRLEHYGGLFVGNLCAEVRGVTFG